MHTTARLTFATLLGLAIAPCLASAQSEKPSKPEAETPSAQAEAKAPKMPPQPYLLKLSVIESDAGKPTVQREYTLEMLADDNHGSGYVSLRDAERIPYTSDKGPQYQNIGTDIDLTSGTRQGEALIVKLSVSNDSLSEKSNGVNLPAVHNWKIQVIAVLTAGKPAVVYSATDSVTGHKVEIVGTAQPINIK